MRRCLRAAFERYRAEYTVAAFRDTVLTRSSARRRFESMSVWVATDARGRVVGTIAAEVQPRATGHLRGMAARPRWHGSGVGQALLDRALAALAARGCRRVTLDTTRPLARAAAFYRRNGFRRTGRVSDFFGMPLFEYARGLTSKRA